MAYLGFILLCLSCLLIEDAFSIPLNGFQNNLGLLNSGLNAGLNAGLSNINLGNLGTSLNSGSTLLSGSVTSAVSPSFNPNWSLNAQSAPLVTEIVPTLQFGDISLEGDLPVTGAIKISGTFPVYGYIGVDGSVQSQGTAYIDTGNGLIDICNCGL